MGGWMAAWQAEEGVGGWDARLQAKLWRVNWKRDGEGRLVRVGEANNFELLFCILLASLSLAKHWYKSCISIFMLNWSKIGQNTVLSFENCYKKGVLGQGLLILWSQVVIL